jgi:glycosyltransferase involved in cell wall biosynthesis
MPPQHMAALPPREASEFPWADGLRQERRARNAPTVTAIVHTRNEEGNVAGAIASAAWADHVLVVDMESEDRTVEIAREMGAEVVEHPNVGYVEPARNFALARVTSDWVLVLDADERVPERLARLLDQVASSGEADVVQIACELWVSGRHVRNSGWGEHWHNRFFRRGHVRWSDTIHCMPEVSGRVLRVPIGEDTCLRHFSYDDLAHFVTKLNRYTDKEADALESEPAADWPWLARFLRREFGWHYTPQEDGTLSSALAMAMLFYRYLSHAKRWERLGFPEVGVPADPRVALRDIAHDGRALHEAGLEAVEAGQAAQATELLRRSVGEQLDLEVLNDLAVVLAQDGRAEEARALLRTCLVVDPDHAEARGNLDALAEPGDDAVPAGAGAA